MSLLSGESSCVHAMRQVLMATVADEADLKEVTERHLLTFMSPAPALATTCC